MISKRLISGGNDPWLSQPAHWKQQEKSCVYVQLLLFCILKYCFSILKAQVSNSKFQQASWIQILDLFALGPLEIGAGTDFCFEHELQTSDFNPQGDRSHSTFLSGPYENGFWNQGKVLSTKFSRMIVATQSECSRKRVTGLSSRWVHCLEGGRKVQDGVQI